MTPGRPAASARFYAINGLAVLDQSNIFVATGYSSRSNRMRHIRGSGATAEVVTLAGGDGGFFKDGPGDQARFSSPSGLVVTGTPSSFVLYVADRENCRVRKISVVGPAVTVTTLGGDGTCSRQDGPLATARFNIPSGLALDSANRIYVTEEESDAVRVFSF